MLKIIPGSKKASILPTNTWGHRYTGKVTCFSNVASELPPGFPVPGMVLLPPDGSFLAHSPTCHPGDTNWNPYLNCSGETTLLPYGLSFSISHNYCQLAEQRGLTDFHDWLKSHSCCTVWLVCVCVLRHACSSGTWLGIPAFWPYGQYLGTASSFSAFWTVQGNIFGLYILPKPRQAQLGPRIALCLLLEKVAFAEVPLTTWIRALRAEHAFQREPELRYLYELKSHSLFSRLKTKTTNVWVKIKHQRVIWWFCVCTGTLWNI